MRLCYCIRNIVISEFSVCHMVQLSCQYKCDIHILCYTIFVWRVRFPFCSLFFQQPKKMEKSMEHRANLHSSDFLHSSCHCYAIITSLWFHCFLSNTSFLLNDFEACIQTKYVSLGKLGKHVETFITFLGPR